MTAIEVANWVSFAVSLACLPLLILVFAVHVAPYSATGIPRKAALGAGGYSIIAVTILYSGQSILDWISSRDGTGSVSCAVDAMLETFFKTSILAHLPVLAYTFHKSIATDAKPDPAPTSAARATLLLSLVYLYALIPLVPTLTTAAALQFRLKNGFGRWWEIYCIDRSGWWRIVRPVTLVPPLALAIVMVLTSSAALYFNWDHPSVKMRPTSHQMGFIAYILFCSFGAIAYLVLEQVVGWYWDWWPRALECLISLFVLLPYTVDRSTWLPYEYWIRFKRVPLSMIDTPDLTDLTPDSPKRYSPGRSKGRRDGFEEHSSTSSFYSSPLMLPDISPAHVRSKSDASDLIDSPRREIAGRSQCLRSKSDTEHSPPSPPFVYSVTQTVYNPRLDYTSIPHLLPIHNRQSDAKVTTLAYLGYLDPSSSSPLRQSSPPPCIIPFASPPKPESPKADDVSEVSCYSDNYSGVTSVMADQRSQASTTLHTPMQTPPARARNLPALSLSPSSTYSQGSVLAPPRVRRSQQGPLDFGRSDSPDSPATFDTFGKRSHNVTRGGKI